MTREVMDKVFAECARCKKICANLHNKIGGILADAELQAKITLLVENRSKVTKDFVHGKRGYGIRVSYTTTDDYRKMDAKDIEDDFRKVTLNWPDLPKIEKLREVLETAQLELQKHRETLKTGLPLLIAAINREYEALTKKIGQAERQLLADFGLK